MGYRKWWMGAFAVAAMSGALLLGACGGDDNGGKSPADMAGNKTESTAPAGDSTAKSEPTKSSSGNKVATGGDEQYVKDICNAGTKMLKAFEKAMSGPTPSDPSKALDAMMAAFVEPFDQMAKDMQKAKPPKDLAEWHSAAVKQLQELVKNMKDGKLNGSEDLFNDAEDPFPEMPAAAEERLQKIAEKTPECQEFNAFGPN